LIIIWRITSFGIWFMILYAKKVFSVQIITLDTLMFYWGLHPVFAFLGVCNPKQAAR